MSVRCHPIDLFFQGVQRVGNCYRAFTERQECVIVFGIPDADHVMRGKSEFLKRHTQSRRFVDAGRKDHDRAFIENNLQFQAKIADDFDRSLFVRLPGRDNDPAHRHTRSPSLYQFASKFFGGSFGQRSSSRVDGRYNNAPFSATIRSKRSSRGNTLIRSSSSLPVTRMSLRPDLPTSARASMVVSLVSTILSDRAVIVAGQGVISHVNYCCN